MAEKEIYCLRETLTMEKARSSELENELNHLKSCYSCEKKVSAETTLVEVVESRRHDFAELEGYQSTESYEVPKQQLSWKLVLILLPALEVTLG